MSTIKYHPHFETGILSNILDVKRAGHYRRKKGKSLSINQMFYHNNIMKRGYRNIGPRVAREELLTLNNSIQNMPLSSLSNQKELKTKEPETTTCDYGPTTEVVTN